MTDNCNVCVHIVQFWSVNKKKKEKKYPLSHFSRCNCCLSVVLWLEKRDYLSAFILSADVFEIDDCSEVH